MTFLLVIVPIHTFHTLKRENDENITRREIIFLTINFKHTQFQI